MSGSTRIAVAERGRASEQKFHVTEEKIRGAFSKI